MRTKKRLKDIDQLLFDDSVFTGRKTKSILKYMTVTEKTAWSMVNSDDNWKDADPLFIAINKERVKNGEQEYKN